MIRTWSVRDWSLGVCLASVLGAHAFGQSLVVPNANVTVAGGDTSGPLPSVPFPVEFQNVIDPAQFSSVTGPIYITGFALRAAPGTGPLNLTIVGSISLSTSPNYPSPAGGHSVLSTTFANNIGADNTTVLSGNVTVSGPGCTGPAPCPFANPIAFTTPFLYNPARGPLLIDVKATSFSATSGQFDVADCNPANCPYDGIFATPLGTPTATKLNSSGSVSQITYVPSVSVVPVGNTTRTGNDTSGPLPSPAASNIEIQTVFGTGQFSALSGPVYITGFTMRAAPGKGPLSVTVNANVYLSSSSNYPNTTGGHPLLSTTFADNVGPDNTLVASGSVSINGTACAAPGPCPFANNIVFAKPFFYDPASGPLLMDVKAASFQGTGQFDVFTCQPPGCGLAGVDGTLGSATATEFNYGGNVTQFTYMPAPPLTPAPTTNFNYTANVSRSSAENGNIVGAAPVVVTPFGNATAQLTITVPVDQTENRTGDPYQATLGVVFNEADSFTLSGSLPSIKTGVAEAFTANVSGGTGAFSNDSGSVNLTLTLADGGTLTGNGSVTVGQKTTAITLQSSFPNEGGEYFTSTITGHGTGTMTPLGPVAIQYNVNDSVLGDPSSLTEAFANFSFNANDGFSASFKLPANSSGAPTNAQGVIRSGTGVFSGASGTATLTVTPSNSGNTMSGSGSVTVPAPGGPVITSVNTASGPNVMAQNTWLEIKGNNLVPSTTPSTGVDWSLAPDFASGKMPILLNGVSVKVNNKPAYMYFFCSAVTATICPVDQINVLAPLDATMGGVTVVVTSPTGTSAPFGVRMETNSPSFLLFDAHGDIAARHLDATFSLLGPTTLFPGFTTPAKSGETIWLAGVGFGLPTTTLVDGSSTQLGPLPVKPICFIGLKQATVLDASVVSPGLYLLTVTVPTGTPSGDNLVTCTYQGNALFNSNTPSGAVINVQ
jgi:uncharacterized protein (TIGR03437 family)